MVEESTRRQIELLGVAESHPGLCDLALCLARSADVATAPTALAAVAAQLRAVMLDLCKFAPARSEGDALDDLADRRAARKRKGA